MIRRSTEVVAAGPEWSRRDLIAGAALAAGELMSGAPASAASPMRGRSGREFNPRRFGARGDGRALDTRAIQAAIDGCAAAGGGFVRLDAGRYLSGTLVLRDHVMLHLDPGATLLGSTDLSDYPTRVPALRSYTDIYTDKCLIYAERAQGVGIVGRGAIDGQGGAPIFQRSYENRTDFKGRPFLIRFVECRDVLVEGVTLRNAAMWMQHFLACEGVVVRGVSVWNHANYNNDGINIDACRDVMVSDCIFDTDDDALTLKSTTDRLCENIVVTNCIVASHCASVKFGTETNAGFRNVTISNLAIRRSRNRGPIFYGEPVSYAGVRLDINDGGTMDGVRIHGLVMEEVLAAVRIQLTDRGRGFAAGLPRPGIGTMRNIDIRDVTAFGLTQAVCLIDGLPQRAIEDVAIADVRAVFAANARDAAAIRCRHAAGLRFAAIEIDGNGASLAGAVIACTDVRDLRADRISAGGFGRSPALAELVRTSDAELRNCELDGRPSAIKRG